MSLQSTRRSALISRFPPPEDKSIWNVPTKSFDLASHQSLGTVISTQTPEKITLDLQSDMRYPTATFARCVSQTYNSLDIRDQPLASPSMLCAYAYHLLATYYLAHDLYSRDSPSEFASNTVQNNELRQFFESTLNAYVPDFMFDILETIAPFTPPTMPNVTVVPSFAGYLSRLDATRTPPFMLFLAAHNIMASYPSNSNPTAITQLWLRTRILRIGTNDFAVNNWLNQLHHDATANTFAEQQNWFNVLINQMFTPITTRAIVNRPTFIRIPINPVSLPANRAVNPYVMMLGYSVANLEGLRSFYNAGSTIANSAYNGKRRLGDFLVATSSGAVLRHFLHASALPTWTETVIAAPTAAQRQNPTAEPLAVDLRTQQEQAATSHFLQPRTPLTLTNNILNVNAAHVAFGYTLTTSRRNHPDPPTVAGATAGQPFDFPEFGRFKTYNPDRDHLPGTMYFGYPELAPTSFAGPIQSGICIEIDEVSSVIVPLPNIHETNSFTNSQILSSLIPASRVTVHNRPANVPIYERTVYNFRSHPFGFTLGTTSFVGLPRFNFRTAPTLGNAPTFAGFQWMLNIHELRLGFTAALGTIDADMNIPTERVNIWSSYRYIRIESSATTDIFAPFTPNIDDPTPAQQLARVHLFSTLRNIVGTQYKYGEGRHPATTFF
nr:capsid protein [Sarcosphaera coronaria partitivirus]